MATSEAIHARSSDHTRILDGLAELDYVPQAFAQQNEYVKDLNNRLKEGSEKLKVLEKQTKKERKEHEELRKSTVRRLAHKLTGQADKFAAKATKEEQEFVEAMEKELVEKDQHRALRQMRDEAQIVLDDLAEKSAKYDSLKEQLNALYHQIFDGPTAEFPQDDSLEYEAQSAQSFHDEVQKAVNGESRAADLLKQAERYMDACLNRVSEALQASQWDIYGARGADYIERNALSSAQSMASQVERLVLQAQGASPFVQPIGSLQIAQGSFMTDVFFDNIFTDMAFHQKIQQSSHTLQRAARQLSAQHQGAIQRANTAGAQLREASQRLDAARRALFDYRQETFKSIATMGRPPVYESEPPSLPTQVTLPTPSIPEPIIAEPEELPVVDQSSAATAKPRLAPGPSWGSNNPYAAFLVRRASTPAGTSTPSMTKHQAEDS